MYVVILGAPGAGKGTQATAIAERYGLVHIATGELLRDAVRWGTEPGKKAKHYMERGELVPDELVVGLVMDRLSEPDADAGALFDGFPRNLRQAMVLDEALRQRGKGVDVALYLKVSEPVLIARLSGRWECASCRTPYHELYKPPKVAGVCDQCGGVLVQRADDRPEAVKRRLQVYMEQTEPVLEHYRKRGILAEVDGEQPIPEVTRQIMAVLAARGEKVR